MIEGLRYTISGKKLREHFIATAEAWRVYLSRELKVLERLEPTLSPEQIRIARHYADKTRSLVRHWDARSELVETHETYLLSEAELDAICYPADARIDVTDEQIEKAITGSFLSPSEAFFKKMMTYSEHADAPFVVPFDKPKPKN